MGRNFHNDELRLRHACIIRFRHVCVLDVGAEDCCLLLLVSVGSHADLRPFLMQISFELFETNHLLGLCELDIGRRLQLASVAFYG